MMLVRNNRDFMRLYAYGGTEFSTRCQIGEWHRIENGALQDKFGLKKDNFSIGVGINDKSAFLIFKELQIGTANREYAYTLLLDPGADIWQAVQWNPLYLTKFLLNPSRRELLLKTPEKIWENPDLLKNLLADFKEELKNDETFEQPFDDFNDFDDFYCLIVGMGLLDEREIENVLVFQTPRPPSNILQWEINDLPVFLRFGQGWFIGGQKENAPSFKVKLIVSDSPDKQTNSAAQKFIDNGRAFLQNWQTIKQTEDFQNVLAKAPRQPLNLLPDEEKKQAREFMVSVEILARLYRQAEIDNNLVELVKDVVQNRKILADEIESVFFQMSSGNKNAVSPEATKIWLELQTKRPQKIKNPPNLDTKTISAYLIENRISPLDSNLNLDFEIGVKILLELITTESDAAKIPLWLDSAIKYLAEMPDAQYHGHINNLLTTALKSTKEKNALDVWLPFRQNEAIFPLVKEPLQRYAFKCFDEKINSPDWKEVYLKFGFDSGGQRLAEKDISAARIEELIKFINLNIDSNTSLKDISVKWIDDLATSPLRSKISPEIKNERPIENRWKNFRSLLGILMSKPEINIEKANEDEIPFLLDELVKMLEGKPKVTLDDIQIDNLNTLLGKLPKEIAARVYKPSISRPTEIEEETAKKKDAKEIAPTELLSGEFQELGQFFGDFANASEPAVFLSKKLNDAPESLAIVFKHLSPRTQHFLLKSWHSEKSESFEQRAINFYQNSIENNAPQTYFTQAVWRYLMTDDGKSIKNIKLIQFGKDISYIEKNLKEWLETEIEPETPHQAETFRNVTAKVSFWAGIKKKVKRMYLKSLVKRKRKSRKGREL